MFLDMGTYIAIRVISIFAYIIVCTVHAVYMENSCSRQQFQVNQVYCRTVARYQI